jgi:hypothetical protein
LSFDIIGDIHGHAARLEALLVKLGYRDQNGAWRHPSRTAIFVGNFIDRGPEQLRTLEIVRAMLDAGAGRAVMGDHELNAIAWATLNPDGGSRYLRTHYGPEGDKNRRQHEAFLAEVGPDTHAHKAWVDWFMELPLWIEETACRVVHACWSPEHADTLRPHLRPGTRLTPELMEKAHRKGTPEFRAVDVLLNGPEAALPDGYTFKDKGRRLRGEIRTRWWDQSARTYAEAYIGRPGAKIPDVALENQLLVPEPDRPVFVGHYRLDGAPAPIAPKVACVDYNVADGGPMTAYRFDGETTLSAAKFVVA